MNPKLFTKKVCNCITEYPGLAYRRPVSVRYMTNGHRSSSTHSEIWGHPHLARISGTNFHFHTRNSPETDGYETLIDTIMQSYEK